MSETYQAKEPLPIYWKDFSNKELISLLKPIVNTGRYDIYACYDYFLSPEDLVNAKIKLSAESSIPIHACVNIDPTTSYYKFSDPYSKQLLQNKSERAVLEHKIKNNEILNIFNNDE
jgi:hypothetical protein